MDNGSLKHDLFSSYMTFEEAGRANETARCNGRVNMRVTITTDGGFTGRGIGSASADVEEEVLARLHPESWLESYTTRGADLVRYTLVFGEHRVMWMETAEIPEEVRELYGRVWGTKC